jgi:hypothetical protein
MPITTITTPPSRNAGLTQDVYSAQMESTLNTMKTAVNDINANASQYNVATSTTSTSSVLIGTGAKTFTVPSGLGFVVGMTLRIANTSANFMTGEVTSYTTTSLVMNITSVGGSGTLASWSISMAAVGASTAASVSNAPAGNISATTVQGAINELDTEKLSSAANAVTDTNLSAVATGATTGDSASIPVVTFTSKGRITTVTTAPKIVSGTAIATTSGTSHDFLSIPSWVKRITIMIDGLSANGSSFKIIQLGDSGGFETSGYVGAGFSASSTYGSMSTGFFISPTSVASDVQNAVATLTLLDSTTNRWCFSCMSGYTAAATSYSQGNKALSATLDRIRLTTVNGTDTFDAGSVNIMYE